MSLILFHVVRRRDQQVPNDPEKHFVIQTVASIPTSSMLTLPSSEETPTPDNSPDKQLIHWRQMGPSGRECIIIASIGICRTTCYVPKLSRTTTTRSYLSQMMRELEVVQEYMKQVKHYQIVGMYLDIPGAQMSKSHYLKKIEQLMLDCKQPGGECIMGSR